MTKQKIRKKVSRNSKAEFRLTKISALCETDDESSVCASAEYKSSVAHCLRLQMKFTNDIG
jgi:hypothetical protein